MGWITLAPQTTATAPASAAADLSFETALGQAKPIFRGTMPFKFYPTYGRGARKTTQVAVEQETTSISWGHIGGGGLMQPATTAYTTKETVVCDMFCTGPRNRFGNDIDLLQIKLNDDIVYDKVAGIKSVDFRYYDGLDNVVDPLVLDITGSDTGSSHIGDCCLVFENLDCSKYSDRPPVVTAILSDAAAEASDTGTLISGAYGALTWSPYWSIYNPETGHVLQYIFGDDNSLAYDQIEVLDAVSGERLYSTKVETATTSAWTVNSLANGRYFIVSDSDAIGSFFNSLAVEVETGKVITYSQASEEVIYWRAEISAESFASGINLALGAYASVHGDLAPNDATIAVLDTNAETLTLINVPVTIDAWAYCCAGRLTGESASFFVVDWPAANSQGQNNRIKEVVWRQGNIIEVNDIYTLPAGFARGVWYDAETGYLAIPCNNGGTLSVEIVNPVTGTLIKSVATTHPFNFLEDQYRIAMFPSPGKVLLPDVTAREVYSLDLTSYAISLYADYPWNGDTILGIYDQTRSLWGVDQFDDDGNRLWGIFPAANTEVGSITLESLLTSLYSLAGYEAADLSFSGITGETVYGWAAQNQSSVSAEVNTLAEVHGFVNSDTGVGIAITKGQRDGDFALNWTIPSGDLVEYDDNGRLVVSQDDDDFRVPQEVAIEFLDKDAGYERARASEARPVGFYEVTPSRRMETISTGLAYSQDTAHALALERVYQSVAGQKRHAFALPPEYLGAVPGDVAQVSDGTKTIVVQFDKVTRSRSLKIDIEATGFLADVDSSYGVPEINYSVTISTAVASQYGHLDIPLLSDGDDQGGAALVQYYVLTSRGQTGWPGARGYQGASASVLTQFGFKGNVSVPLKGILTAAVAAPAENWVTDYDREITLRITAGAASDLVTASHAEVMSGVNLAVIGAPGRWEMVAFETVTDNQDGTYTLTGLQRGMKGSEIYSGTSEAGDAFWLLKSAYVGAVAFEPADLGTERYFKAVGVGGDIATAPVVKRTISGAAETPYAPVNLAAELNGSDIDLSWDWRSRLDHLAILTGNADTIHGEDSLSFEIDVMDGATVKRTLTTSTNAKTYAAADIVTDFGSTPAEITFRVYQISALVDRGYRAEATITL